MKRVRCRSGCIATNHVEGKGSNPLTRNSLNGQTYFTEVEKYNIENIYLKKVKTDLDRKTFCRIVPMFHSYKQTTNFVGRQINWLIMCNTSCIGVIGLGSSVMAMKPRDKFIGWDKDTRLNNLTKTANNWRFTVLPNAPKNTGSKSLSLLLKLCKKEWMKKFGDKLVLLETLVEPPRNGGVYLANGWVNVGHTKGTEFLWMKRDEVDVFLQENPKASICSKNMKFGDKVNTDTVQVVIPDSKSKKLIFVKPLHRYWKKELNKVD